MAKYVRPPVVQHNVAIVLAASVQAWKENDCSIVKYNVIPDPATATVTHYSNRELIDRYLENPASITDESHNEAEELVNILSGEVTLGVLSSKKISDFTQLVLSKCNQPTVSNKEIGIMVYFPTTAANYRKASKQRERIFEFQSSVALGVEGEKVSIQFSPIDVKYVNQLNCHSVFGHDNAGNCVEFLTTKDDIVKNLNDFVSGNVTVALTGKIKKVGPNQYRSNVTTNFLNYVKIAK